VVVQSFDRPKRNWGDPETKQTPEPLSIPTIRGGDPFARDLVAIAEGIETAEQHRRLNALGCDFGQGYLFARQWVPSQRPPSCAKDRRIFESSSIPAPAMVRRDTAATSCLANTPRASSTGINATGPLLACVTVR
jgi:hypothetical protein